MVIETLFYMLCHTLYQPFGILLYFSKNKTTPSFNTVIPSMNVKITLSQETLQCMLLLYNTYSNSGLSFITGMPQEEGGGGGVILHLYKI